VLTAPTGRQVRQTAVTVLLAGLLCWWAVRGMDWPVLRRTLAAVELWRFGVVVLGYVAVFYALDVAGFVLAYRRHLVRRVPVRDIVVVVCGKQLLGVVLPVLTKAVAPVYFRRRWGIGALRTIGASELVSFADSVAVSTTASLALSLGRVPLPAAYTWVLVVWWILTAGYLIGAWVVPRGWWRRLRGSALLSPFASATPGEMAAQVGIRVLGLVVTAGVLAVLLAEAGIRVGAGQLALFAPLLLFSAMLPVSVGGFGGPQAVAALLLHDVWRVTDDAGAVAFSVLWSSAFLLGRLVLSAPFAVPLAGLLRPGRAGSEKEDACAAAPNAT
jgi:hypothetical protein